MFRLHILKFYYRFENECLPSPLLNLRIVKNCYYHTYNTRSRNKLSTPTHHHVFFHRSITYAITPVINSLEASIRAYARPRPRPAPVTTTTCPPKSRFGIHSFLRYCYLVDRRTATRESPLSSGSSSSGTAPLLRSEIVGRRWIVPA